MFKHVPRFKGSSGLGSCFFEIAVSQGGCYDCGWVYQKECHESKYDRTQAEHGHPVCPQDVEAHMSLPVDIWMIDLMISYNLNLMCKLTEALVRTSV